MATPELPAKLAAEFVGTFLLVFTVGCNVLSGNAVWGGVSIACVLMVSIYALGGISGANFNPAVSLALGLTKAMKGPGLAWKEVGMYMGTQVFAGLIAGCIYSVLFSSNFDLEPSKGFGGWQAGLVEVLYTFMLCFVVLNVAVALKSHNAPNEFYGLAIGFVIVAGAYGAGAVSGGCFNPAVAIGIDAVSTAKGFGWCILYTLCEFVGACLAAGAFRLVRPQEFGDSQAEETGKNEIAKLVSEFLGTYMLVLTVGLNVLAKSPAGAFSIAASLMCMIYALGNVSGAHFNPAVTLAIFASHRDADLNARTVASYVVVQILGGILAAFTYSAVRHGDSFPLAPGTGFDWGQVATAETMFTFILCYVVLCVAVSKTTKSPVMFGLAIGSCVTVGGNAVGAVSGGSLNPAVSFGIACATLQGHQFLAALAYTLFEVLGAGIAIAVFTITHASDSDTDAKENAPLKGV